MKLSTKLIHGGIEPDPSTGAIMTPIFQTSTYVQEAPGKNKGFEYARSQNPTRKVLEEALAISENAKFGLSFSSGVAATDAVIKLLQPGDEVIAGSDMYGGTYRLFTKVFARFGINFHYVDMSDIKNIDKKINAHTKLIWIETPTNPLLNIVDIEAVTNLVKGKISSPASTIHLPLLICKIPGSWCRYCYAFCNKVFRRPQRCNSWLFNDE